MAEKHRNFPDEINEVLYVNSDNPKGFKKEYLSQNLSEMEEQFIICPNCEGITRDACTYEGQLTCELCCKNRSEAKAVNQVRTVVAKLGIRCPLLRDCDWTGQLSEGSEHVGICGSALLSCSLGCDGVFRRSQNDHHLMNECPLRNVICQFCAESCQSKDLMGHLDKCSDRPINCLCGTEIIYSRMEVHIETECSLAEVECPYAKYSCKVGSILRKDMLAHKKEFYIEHQDMLEERCMKLEKENFELSNALKTKKNLDGVDIKINFNYYNTILEATEFMIAYNEFNCFLSGTDPMKISIRRSLFGPGTYGSLPVKECHLFLDPTTLFKEPYYEVFKLNLKFGGGSKECVMTLDKSIYSNYLQEDGTLLMRLYFALNYPEVCKRQDKYSIYLAR